MFYLLCCIKLDLNLNKIIRHFKNYEPLEGQARLTQLKDITKFLN